MHILALHGFTGRGDDFKNFSPLCGPKIEWNYPDLPGHGPMPSLHCTPRATIDFVNGQKPETPRIALGYSMGARAALLHAINTPGHWDALILISATAGLESEAERMKRAANDQLLAERLLNKGVSDFLNYWQQTPIIRSQQTIQPDWLEQMRLNRRQHTAEGLAASLQQFGQANFPNLWDKLGTLHCPILLITGEKDEKYCASAKRMKMLLPHARWVCIPGTGHMPHMEAPTQTASAIETFRNTFFKNDTTRTT